MAKTKASPKTVKITKATSKSKILKKKGKVLDVKKRGFKFGRGKKQKEERGVVYLSHIPHGFYEEQMSNYFSQFGNVTQVSVPKGKTGKPRGYAFIEFKHPQVAEIAAETMNNYLMFKRVLKAKYIPPKDQKPKFFMAASNAKLNHTTAPEKARMRMERLRRMSNRPLKSSLEVKAVAKLLRTKKKLKSTIEKLGLDYDFQVDEGNVESVFQKRKELLENKKNQQETTFDKENLSSDDEELSSLDGDVDFSDLDSDFLSEDSDSKKAARKKKISKSKTSKLLSVGEKKKKSKIVEEAKSLTQKDEVEETQTKAGTQNKGKNKKKKTPLKDKLMKRNLLVASLLETKSVEKNVLTPQRKKSNALLIEDILKGLTKKQDRLLKDTDMAVGTKSPKQKKMNQDKKPDVSKLVEKQNKEVKDIVTLKTLSPKPKHHHRASLKVKTPQLESGKKIAPKQSSNITPKSQKVGNLAMEVDKNDQEINFKTPPNVIKKSIGNKDKSSKKTPKIKKSQSPNSSTKASPEKSPSPIKLRSRKSLKKLS